MKLIQVWLRRPDGQADHVGELATGDVQQDGRFEAEFEYDERWLRSGEAFDLDPASLSRAKAARFRAPRGFGPPLGIFSDALPDDWGRRLLSRELRESGIRPTDPAMLLRVSGHGIGALLFSETASLPELSASASTSDVADLIQAAEDFDRGTLEDGHRFRRLLHAGGTPGGARPKALVQEGATEWLAKFPCPSRDNGHDVVGLEAAGLDLARQAGIDVPDFELRRAGARRFLLVRRFDVLPGGGRAHMASMKTLLRERSDYQVDTYRELIAAVRKYSASPQADVDRIYRRAVFNVAFGNVDDHTKNFWFVHGEAGWRLSKAFDLVPDIQASREHSLAIGHDRGAPNRSSLLSLGGEVGATEPRQVVLEVTGALEGLDEAFERHGLAPTPLLASIKRDIQRRVALLQATDTEPCGRPRP